MDPASASQLRDFLARSNSRMVHQDEQRAASNRAIQALVSQVSELTTQLQRLQSEPEQRTTAANPPAPTIPDQAVVSSNPAFHLQPFILVSPSNAAPFLPNAHSTSLSNHRRFLPKNLRSHSSSLYSLDGQLSGEPPFGSRNFPAALRFSHFRRRSERCLIGRLWAERRLVFWRSYGREIGASLISPLNSALWRQSAGGTQKRSGICSFMDLLIMSRMRSTHWNYPLHWMG